MRPPILLALFALVMHPTALHAAGNSPQNHKGVSESPPSYSDLMDLTDSAPLVIKAQIRKATPLEPARAPGVRPGWVRLYLEVKVQTLIYGTNPLSEAQQLLGDVRLDAKGKVPSLSKAVVLLFARTVPGHSGELQLTRPDGWIRWDSDTETRLRGVLAELNAPTSPGKVTGVREALYVPGNLTGEGETQIFLIAPGDAPAAVTITHRPGQPVSWTASFSELVDNTGKPPAKHTLAWYRLACFMPAALPASANVSEASADRRQAAQDYSYVIDQLGACGRTR